MNSRIKRKLPINSGKRNTCGVDSSGTPIPETDIRELIKDGLIDQVPMSEEQKAATRNFMKGVKSI